MQAVEFAVLDAIQALRCGFLDAFLPLFTRLCDHGELWIVLAVLLMLIPRTRRTGCSLALALLADLLLCNLFLKPLIGRARPFAVKPGGVELLVPPPGDASFPSGHTAVSFTAAASLRLSGSRLWLPSLAVSLLMAFSRLYLYVHWPSDVLGGMLAGVLAGWLGNTLADLLHALMEKRKKHPRPD